MKCRFVTDRANRVHVYAAGEHDHIDNARVFDGRLTPAQKRILDGHFAEGRLTPSQGMKHLTAANGGNQIPNLGNKSAKEFQASAVKQYLKRKREQLRRSIGDTFGDIITHARATSIYTARDERDEHEVSVVYAKVGDVEVNGEDTSSAPNSARTEIDRRIGPNGVPGRTNVILVFATLSLIASLMIGGNAFNYARVNGGENIVFLQDDIVHRMMQEGLAVHAIGTTDVQQRAHVAALSVVSHENEVPNSPTSSKFRWWDAFIDCILSPLHEGRADSSKT